MVVLNETWHTTLFGIYYYFQIFKIEIIVICLKLRAKLRFKAFLSVFCTFLHKVVQTWFVWHETWHTTLFGIYYYFEMVIFENSSHVLEITC